MKKIFGKLKKKLFGHRWTYYRTTEGQDIRFCRFCKTAQVWKTVPGIDGPFWANLVQYKTLGAKLHVRGFDK